MIGGLFVWNVMYKNSVWLFINILFLGMMGVGKLIVFKMIVEVYLVVGDFIWGFEKGKDFIFFLKEYNGIMVCLDGFDGMINFLEIFVICMYDEVFSLYDDGLVKDLKINEVVFY